MGNIHLVIGGARSGKSRFAENIAKTATEKVLYIATAIVTDDDMAERIRKHREDRPWQWKTLEQTMGFHNLPELEAFQASEVVLLDCLTVMMTNLMFQTALDYDHATHEEIRLVEQRISEEIDALIQVFRETDKRLVIVSNEVGMDLVPAYRLGSIFRDIAGRMNQRVAAMADEVTLIVAGLPLSLKK